MIIVVIRWTGLAPRQFQFLFPGSLTPTFLPVLADRAVERRQVRQPPPCKKRYGIEFMIFMAVLYGLVYGYGLW